MKIRHIAAASILALILAADALASSEPFPRFHGEGTEEAPFLLESAEDMQLASSLISCGEIYYDLSCFPDYFGNTPLYYADACYRLNGDIDCGGAYISPFGTAEYPFAGEFDGAGFSVTNAEIGSTSSADGTVLYAGLFGYAVDAVIHDLGIENALLECEPSGKEAYAGILCGKIENADGEAAFERCYVSGAKITVASQNTDVNCGGLIGGINTPSIKHSVYVGDSYAADVTIDATGLNISAGGVVGYAGKYPVEITRCYASGSIKAVTASKKNVQAGGVIGKAQTIREWSPWLASTYDLESCFADVAITAESMLTAIIGTVCGRCIGDASSSNMFTVRQSVNSLQDMHVDGKVITADKAKTLSFWRDSLGMNMTDVWYLPEDGYPVLRTNAGLSVSTEAEDDGTLTVTVGTFSGFDTAEGRLIAALYEGDPAETTSWKKPFPSFRMTDVKMADCTMDGGFARDTVTFTFDDVPAFGHIKVFFLSDDGFAVLSPSAATDTYGMYF